jgi:hypothetical protein
MTQVLTSVSILSALVSCSAVVVPTTLVQIPQHRAFDFADYLDEQDLSDVVANNDVLRSAAPGGVFLDILPMAEVAPDAVFWLKEHSCPRLPGCCRVALAQYALMADLLTEYPGNSWEAQGYTAIAASALEVSVALELRGCSTLVQLELPAASHR